MGFKEYVKKNRDKQETTATGGFKDYVKKQKDGYAEKANSVFPDYSNYAKRLSEGLGTWQDKSWFEETEATSKSISDRLNEMQRNLDDQKPYYDAIQELTRKNNEETLADIRKMKEDIGVKTRAKDANEYLLSLDVPNRYNDESYKLKKLTEGLKQSDAIRNDFKETYGSFESKEDFDRAMAEYTKSQKYKNMTDEELQAESDRYKAQIDNAKASKPGFFEELGGQLNALYSGKPYYNSSDQIEERIANLESEASYANNEIARRKYEANQNRLRNMTIDDINANVAAKRSAWESAVNHYEAVWSSNTPEAVAAKSAMDAAERELENAKADIYDFNRLRAGETEVPGDFDVSGADIRGLFKYGDQGGLFEETDFRKLPVEEQNRMIYLYTEANKTRDWTLVNAYKQTLDAEISELNAKSMAEFIKNMPEWADYAALIPLALADPTTAVASALPTAAVHYAGKAITGSETPISEAEAGVVLGLQSAFDNAVKAFDTISRNGDTFTYKRSAELASAYVAEDMGKVEKVVWDLMVNTGNQLPHMAVSALTKSKMAGLAVMGVQVYGSSFEEGLSMGMTTSQARDYAIIDTALEVGLESWLGNMPGVRGVLSEKVGDKLASTVKTQAAKVVLSYLGGAWGEFVEEGLQDVISPMLQNFILGQEIDFSTDAWVDRFGDFVYSGLIGALSSIMLGGSAGQLIEGVKADVSTIKTGKRVGIEGVQKLTTTLDAGSNATRILERVSENASAWEIGNAIRDAQMEVSHETYENMVSKLVEYGYPEKIANITAYYAVAYANGAEITEEQRLALQNDPILSSAMLFALNGETRSIQEIQSVAEEKREGERTTAEKAEAIVQAQAEIGNAVRESEARKAAEGKAVFDEGNATEKSTEIERQVGKLNEMNEVVSQESVSAFKNILNNTSENFSDIATQSAIAYRMGVLSDQSVEQNKALADMTKSLTDTQRRIMYQQGQMDAISMKSEKAKKKGGDVALPKGYSYEQLNESEKAQYDLASIVSKSTGVKIEFLPPDMHSNGYYKNGTVYINLNAGINTARGETGTGTLLFTLSHELTHHIEKTDRKAYNQLRSMVVAELGYKQFESLVEQKMETEFNDGKQKFHYNRTDATAEVIADAMEYMLADGSVVEKWAKQNRSTWQKIKDWLDETIAKIEAFLNRNYNRMDSTGRIVSELENFKSIQEVWANALSTKKTASENTAKQESVQEKAKNLQDGILQNNLKATKEHIELLKKAFSSESATTYHVLYAKYKKVVDMWEKITAEMDDDFVNAWNNKEYKNRAFAVFKEQMGYKFNAEFATMCKKGISVFEAIDQIVKRNLAQELNHEVIDLADKQVIYDVLRKNGFQVPCEFCYVEQARQREGVIIKNFLDGDSEGKIGFNQALTMIEEKMAKSGVKYKFDTIDRAISDELYAPKPAEMDEKTQTAFYNALVETVNEVKKSGYEAAMADYEAKLERRQKAIDKGYKRIPKEPRKPAKPTYLKALFNADGSVSESEVKKIRKQSPNEKIFFVLATDDSIRYKFAGDLLYSSYTTMNISSFHPSFYSLFNIQGGVSGYKTKQRPVVYFGDVLKSKATSYDTKKEGGLRNQSNSDFQMYTFLDQMQMFADLTAKGYYYHAYTKVPSFALLFGLSRGKINLSVVPKYIRYTKADGSFDMEKTMANAGLDRDGNILWDNEEGMPYNIAKGIVHYGEYSKNITAIAIGVSDAHIRKLLDENWVQLIIGFHDKTDDPNKRFARSAYFNNYNGRNEAVKVTTNADGEEVRKTVHIVFSRFVSDAEAKFKSKTDKVTFTNRSNGKTKTYTWNDIPKLAADMYLDYCFEKKYEPAYNIEGIVDHENYYKLLGDFGLYDINGNYAPHEKVNFTMPDSVPQFDENGNVSSMIGTDDYIKQELEKEMSTMNRLSFEMAQDDGILQEMVRGMNEAHAETAEAQHSLKDQEYMQAVESNDTAKMNKMVREAANEAGYTSPKLYHGTNAFGFTKISTDPTIAKGADYFSFWASDKKDAAGTYTNLPIERGVTQEVDNDLIQEAYDIANEKLDEAIDEFRYQIDMKFSEWVFGQSDNSYLRKLVDNASAEIGTGDGVYDKLLDIATDAFYDHKDQFEEYEDFVDFQENSKEWEEIENAIIAVEGAKSALAEVDDYHFNPEHSGVYGLYANTDNMFVMDAKGALWNNLHPEGLPKIQRGEFTDIPYKTRDVARWAKENGYKGVIFKNIRDNGQYGRTGLQTVYTFFNPTEQVKSADPITYDDNGEIIPLSERFNRSNDDIRYSLKSSARDEVKKVLSDISYDGEVQLTDSSPSIIASQKGVKNLPLVMNASHIRSNILTDDEAKSMGLNPKNEHYHGLGEEIFFKVIEDLDNIDLAYRGTKKANDSSRRENYFLLISKVKDKNGNTINVPVYVNQKGQVNRVFIDVNRVATVFGRESFNEYIKRQLKDGNLVRIKNRSTQVGEQSGLIPARYGLTTSDKNNTTPKAKSQEGNLHSFKTVTDDEIAKAKKHFGTTKNFNEAGYLLKDGEMLDFSGRHWVKGQNASYLDNGRTVDHRDIEEILQRRGEYNQALDDMVGSGNIRLMPETNGITIAVAPTNQQIQKLYDFFARNGREWKAVDFQDAQTGETIASVEYDGKTSPSRIINDIKNFYKDGTIPKSTADNNNYLYNLKSNAARSLAPTFYSKLERTLESMPKGKYDASTILKTLQGKGVKAEELKWSGLPAYLEGKKSVTKDELLEVARANRMQIEEVVLDYDDELDNADPYEIQDALETEAYEFFEKQGINIYAEANIVVEKKDRSYIAYAEYDDGRKVEAARYDPNERATRWKKYTFDDDENYAEYLFVDPMATYTNDAMQVHWKRYGVLVHARVADQMKKGGNKYLIIEGATEGKVLFVEEIQSDWHNAGHKYGYSELKSYEKDDKYNKTIAELGIKYYERIVGSKFYERMGSDRVDIDDMLDDIRHEIRENVRFNKTDERFIDHLVDRYADDEEIKGYVEDYARGVIQAERERKSAMVAPMQDTYQDFAMKKMLRLAAERDYQYIGWTTADIQDERWDDNESHDDEDGLSGNLKGYTIEYDQQIPKFMNKFGKQFGTQVEKITLKNNEEVWAMKITPEMRNSVLYEGQPLFSLKDNSSPTQREILATALKKTTASAEEKQLLTKYLAKVDKLNALEKELSELRYNRQLAFTCESEHTKKPAGIKTTAIYDEEIAKKLKTISNADSELLKLEAMTPVRNLLKNAKAEQRRRTTELVKERQKRTATRHKIVKQLDNFNRMLTRPQKDKYVPASMVKSVIDFLESIDRSTGLEKEAGQAKLALMVQAYERLQNDPTFKEAYDEGTAKMLKDLAVQIPAKRLIKMSQEELDMVDDALTQLNTVIKNSRRFIGTHINGFDIDIGEITDKLSAETNSTKRMNMVQQYIRNYLNKGANPRVVFNALGGFIDNSYWNRLYRMLEEGTERMNEYNYDVEKMFEPLLNDKAAKKEIEAYGDPSKLYTLPVKDANGEPIRMTKGMLLSLYMHLLNEDNTRHLFLGGLTMPDMNKYYGKMMRKTAYSDSKNRYLGVSKDLADLREAQKSATEAYEEAASRNDTDGLLKATKRLEEIDNQYNEIAEKVEHMRAELIGFVSSQMTETDRAFVNAVQEYFKYSSNKLNEVSLEAYGFKKFSVENYFPIVVDRNWLKTDIENFGRTMDQFSVENAGFAKDRVKSRKPMMLVDIVDQVARSKRMQSLYYGNMLPLRNFKKVYGRTSSESGTETPLRSTIDSMYRSHGNYMTDIIDHLMKNMNGQNAQNTLAWIRGRNALAALTLNPRVAGSQAASYINALPLLDAKALGAGLKTAFKKADTELIDKWTKERWVRRGEANSMGEAEQKKLPLKYLTGWIESVDSWTINRLWYASENYIQRHTDLEQGTDKYYKAVADKFNEVVRVSQPMYDTIHRPDILRSEKAFTRLLTMFYTQRLQNFSQIYEAVGKAIRAEADFKEGKATKTDLKSARKNFRRNAAAVLGSAGVLTIMKTFIDLGMHRFKGYRDDDDELTGWSVFGSSLKNYAESLVSNLLFVSNLWEFVDKWVNDEQYYGVSLGAADMIVDASKSLYNFFDSFRDAVKSGWDEKKSKTLMSRAYNLAKSICQFMGIPANNIHNIANFIYNWGWGLANGDVSQDRDFFKDIFGIK